MIKLACLCVLLSFGCDSLLLGQQGSSVGLDENLLPPAETEDGWVVSDLDTEGIQAELVRDLVRQIQGYPRNLHSFLIVRNGKLVLESYFGGWERERMHELRSCSKSVNSLLVGIAIDQGALDGVEHAVFDLFPQYAGFDDPSKAGMRVEHLLTMRTADASASTLPGAMAASTSSSCQSSTQWWCSREGTTTHWTRARPIVT